MSADQQNRVSPDAPTTCTATGQVMHWDGNHWVHPSGEGCELKHHLTADPVSASVESIIEAAIVAHLAETIAAEGDGFWIKCRCGVIGEVESDAEDWEPANEWFAAHQAAAVLAALQEVGTVEWALQQKTFIDGDYDQTYTSSAIYRNPFTEDEAKNHQWLDPRSPVPTRVVSRLTLPWQEVERG